MRPRETFDSPYDQYAERRGQPFEVVCELTEADGIDTEVGPMYLIRFADGIEIQAWPEEVDASLDIYGKEA